MAVSWINSKTEICNLALAAIGTSRIDSIDNTSDNQARRCRDHYDEVRDYMLVQANWGFAIKRAILAAFTPAPIFGESYQYIMPSDYLKMISLNDIAYDDDTNDYRIETVGEVRLIVTEQSDANIRYIYRNDTPANYSPSFVRAFAMQLASRLVFELTGDANLAARLKVEARDELYQAMRESYNEVQRPIKLIDSPLVNARRYSTIG